MAQQGLATTFDDEPDPKGIFGSNAQGFGFPLLPLLMDLFGSGSPSGDSNIPPGSPATTNKGANAAQIATGVAAAAAPLFLGSPNVRTPEVDSIFPTEASANLAGGFASFLSERLNTPVTETEQFDRLANALNERLARLSGRSRQRAGDVAQAGGFADSGVLREQFADIDRAELETFASGLRDIIQFLELQRTEGVLPFLGAASGEELAIENLLQESSIARAKLGLAERSQFFDLLDIFSKGGAFGEGGAFEGVFT